ncbi:hypothetical protein [Streptomyces collinus]|uniref:hypothetical protein n=1 Tax=Streptomyces collinus TaxID=42684 RepID=UPI002942BAF6|nr:hypothetical protein [Streptomyces collinus]
MIQQVWHDGGTGTGPAALALALAVAHELHAPDPAPRAGEVAVPELMGLRTSADRPHRRKVPLCRLTAVGGLAALGV